MGKTKTPRDTPYNPVMRMEQGNSNGIPPYRMNQIVKTAGAITDQLVNGKHLYKPTYHECEICIELVMEAIKKSKNEYRRK